MSSYRLTIDVTVGPDAEGAPPGDALAAATRRTLEAIADASGANGKVVAVEVLTADDAHQSAIEPRFPEIVGIAEIADLLGITRQRASALSARAGFPAPVATLRAGPVWRLADLSNFAKTWDHKTDRPAERPAPVAAPAAPPVDVAKLVGTLANFVPSPYARNALKLVRWYVDRPK